MTYYASTIERAALIKGLRALADYLESNLEVPAPSYSDVLTFPPDSDCPGMRAEIDAIAARLSVAAYETGGGHYVAARSFGPVEYRAVAICKHNHHGKSQGADR
jgi:hypothetical protein